MIPHMKQLTGIRGYVLAANILLNIIIWDIIYRR